MFDKVLASVRIGAAEVDTLLDKDRVMPGGTLPVRVVVDGGEVDQEIDGIELHLKTERLVDDNSQTYVIRSWEVADDFVIHEDERKVFDAELDIPLETPISTGSSDYQRTRVWIDTDLEIEQAIDADDTDYLDVEATDPMQAMLEAVSKAGNDIHKVTVDDDRIRAGNAKAKLPLDQEFEFRPRRRADYEEVEIHFLPREGKTYVLVEFDHRSGEEFEVITISHHNYSVDSLKREFERLR